MVSKIDSGSGKESFKCDVCGLVYISKKNSEDCEDWCSEHKSCNLDINKYAVSEST